MRHATSLGPLPHLVEQPMPARAARQLRAVFDLLADAAAVPEPIPLRASLQPVRMALQPRLAWPERVQPARLPDGTAAPRRDDFYHWILVRRRRAQIAARRALDTDVREEGLSAEEGEGLRALA